MPQRDLAESAAMTSFLLVLALWAAALQFPPFPQAASGEKPPIPPGSYAGTAACRPCHRDKVDTFLRTAHHLDSRLGDTSSVDGDFTPGRNRLNTSNPFVYFTMEARPGGLFVNATSGNPPQTRTERIDIVTGSDRKGQTYLYWKGEQLFELPVSLWAAQKAWVNSPGYVNGTVNFERPIPPRCLDCHATYFEWRTATANSYNRTGVILGIECEKCHGPGRSHIAARQAKKPIAAPAHDVVNMRKLVRDRQIDLCATCHAGGMRPIAPAFSYVPGEPISGYLESLPTSQPLAAEVHGNQVGLLKSSRCYRQSESMTCSTCHDVHTPQRDTTALSGACQSCHKVEACKMFAKAGPKIASRCVDCHMPNQRSGVISVMGASSMMIPDVRTHAIKIYPDASAAVLRTMAQ